MLFRSDAIKAGMEFLASKLGESVIVLVNQRMVVVRVSDGFVKSGVNAGKIVGEISRACGANGGGRPNLAQGGIKDFSNIDAVLENAHRKVSAGDLNDVLQDAYMLNSPTYKKNKKLRIFYATQTGVTPPTFVLFVNDINLMENNYLRYLENNIRKAFNFEGTPIRITMKCKKEEDI